MISGESLGGIIWRNHLEESFGGCFWQRMDGGKHTTDCGRIRHITGWRMREHPEETKVPNIDSIQIVDLDNKTQIFFVKSGTESTTDAYRLYRVPYRNAL